MATFDRLADLPLTVDDCALEALERDVSSDFTRKSTVIRLRGGGHEGVGEDVTYDGEDHDVLQEAGPPTGLAGEGTLADFCDRVEALDLWPRPPAREPSRHYRIWGFESAALDLALRQAGRALHEVLDRPLQPVTFVVSLRLPEPPSHRPDPPAPGALPVAAPQAGPHQRLGPRARRRARRDRRRRLASTSRASTRGRWSTRAPTPSSTAWWPSPSPTRGSRIRASPRRPTRCCAPTATASRGTRSSTPSPTSRRCPSRRGWSTSSPPASGRCAGCWAPTTSAPSAGSGCTAAASSSSAPAAARSSSWPRSSIPTRPNDVAPGGFNDTDPPPGLPTSPLQPEASPTGFRWGEWSQR